MALSAEVGAGGDGGFALERRPLGFLLRRRAELVDDGISAFNSA